MSLAASMKSRVPKVELNRKNMEIANAPVSYGVFGLATDDTELPSGEDLARMISEAGYTGIDLGALGLLGIGKDLKNLLERYELGLAGGWVELPFGAGTDIEFDEAFKFAETMMAEFVVGAQVGHSGFPLPKPTLADSGDQKRKMKPGGSPDLELNQAEWNRFGDRLARVAKMVRNYDLEPTFHHHACTYVETPAEIDKFLEIGDVDLTFDSGHLMLGGGNPVVDLSRWINRVNHLHIKDADKSILKQAFNSADPMRDVWTRRVFTPLGEGDLDVSAMMEVVVESQFDQWLVVEQDVILQSEADIQRAQKEQIANRNVLRKWVA